jgi:hypothetical protein
MPKGIYKRTEECKRILSEARIGIKYFNRKRPLPFSEEHKRNIGKAHKGHVTSEETKKKISKSLLGHSFSKETINKMSEMKKRDKNYNWKGEISDNGYKRFIVPDECKFSCMANCHGYVRIHRLIMAEYLQRPLAKKEIVHHIDGDLNNNKIENLMLLKNYSEHAKLHNLNRGRR